MNQAFRGCSYLPGDKEWCQHPVNLCITYLLIVHELHQIERGDDMGMTNKQFQGFIRLILTLVNKYLKEEPDNENFKELQDILQSMLEDGN